MKLKTILIGTLALAVSAVAGTGEKMELDIKSMNVIDTPKKIEPSGLTFNENGNMIIVSDNGRICFENKSKMVCKKTKKKRDFEGASYDYLNKRLYLAEEGKDNILVYRVKDIDKAKIKKVTTINIPRKKDSFTILGKDSKNGIEGLTFLYETEEKTFFAITNQSKKTKGEDSSLLIIISVETADLRAKVKKTNALVERYIETGIKDMSGLFFYKQKIYVISDKKDLLFSVNLDSLEIENKWNLPGEGQEGLFILHDQIFIAQDSGGVLNIKLNKEF